MVVEYKARRFSKENEIYLASIDTHMVLPQTKFILIHVPHHVMPQISQCTGYTKKTEIIPYPRCKEIIIHQKFFLPLLLVFAMEELTLIVWDYVALGNYVGILLLIAIIVSISFLFYFFRF